MEVFVGLELDDGQAAGAVEREQVEHAAIADGDGRNLREQQIAAQAGQKLGQLSAKPRLKPALGLHAKEGIGMNAVRPSTLKQPRQHLGARRLVLFGQRRLVRARAEGDFIPA